MTENPHLLHEAPHSWRLSPQTRELGRRGVAQARAALRDAARRTEATRLAAEATGDGLHPALHQHEAHERPLRGPEHRSAA